MPVAYLHIHTDGLKAERLRGFQCLEWGFRCKALRGLRDTRAVGFG